MYRNLVVTPVKQPSGTDERTHSLPGDKPLIVVTVGSDHHPFDRLIGWIDRWLSNGAKDRVDCVVQYGTARPPKHGIPMAYLPHDELMRLMHHADAVVVQGGPMSVVESVRTGKLPIAVPRIGRLGEVVDDHQVTFCRVIGAKGGLLLAEDEEATLAHLESILADPEHGVARHDTAQEAQIQKAIQRFGDVADQVMNEQTPRARVLMLGGFGRSGSTLLERCLAETRGVTALGEVLHLWERGLVDDELCGCSSRFSECAFWQDIGRRAFGGWERVDAAQLVEDRRLVVRNRHLPELTIGLSTPGRRLRRLRFLRHLNSLYQAAHDSSRGDILVDSSKHPAYAYLLRRAAVNLKCVLVVRDPRGVAFSWSKVVKRPESSQSDAYMPRYSTARAVFNWAAYGTAFHGLSLLRVPVMTVHYEDFMDDPSRVVKSIMSFAGNEAEEIDTSHLGSDSVTLTEHHTVAGNPIRFTTGRLAIRADHQWRHEMPAIQRLVATVVSAPLNLIYRFRLRR
ncbi:sulfotransferase [Arthrobacter castelli]|uniref:sulfotransferase n=1 Tax=Arthrobacter castelli TaxID=271431 RepID=UPI0009D67C6B